MNTINPKKLSVVIPAYNEERTITKILDRIKILAIEDIKIQIQIINDCSTDKTQSIIEKYIEENGLY